MSALNALDKINSEMFRLERNATELYPKLVSELGEAVRRVFPNVLRNPRVVEDWERGEVSHLWEYGNIKIEFAFSARRLSHLFTDVVLRGYFGNLVVFTSNYVPLSQMRKHMDENLDEISRRFEQERVNV